MSEAGERKPEWQVALDLLRQTDRDLLLRTANKMLNFLCMSGIQKAEELKRAIDPDKRVFFDAEDGYANRPHRKAKVGFSVEIAQEIYDLAATFLEDGEILKRIHAWIQEDKLTHLVLALHKHQPLSEVADVLRRVRQVAPDGRLPPSHNARGIQVSLIRRILSSRLDYISVAKNYIDMEEIYRVLRRAIFSSESRGRVGGKGAGLVLAKQILKKSKNQHEVLKNVRVPKTWYITSDMMIPLMHYNNFDEIVEQKYKDINQVRMEYPHIVQALKNAYFPPDMVQGLSVALDDFQDAPLIVRSSSLLEDQVSAVFSGKYKSLFLANQGTKEERLEALMDAIAEVYASSFGPDPIEYRAERGLLDFKEEMGILLQEVVGSKVGNYFFPAYAGVAFSRNEFRWSPRIRREDGVVRLVPGLGTRAVDRTSDDYPILFAPGQPGLKVNVSVDETVRYTPRMMDVINLETNTFETVEIAGLLQEHGDDFPNLERIVSIYDHGNIRPPVGLNLDPGKDDLVVTFDGLISRSPFVNRIRTIMQLLEERLGVPVDIEFASDGKNFYLLQCRPQSYGGQAEPTPIPSDIREEDRVFTADRYVSNGRVPEISHIVYVDPAAYATLESLDELQTVGRAVARLNEFLPRRRFILMGPGRWGSRGDIKLGVNVTYSSINNTAMLIEVARKTGKYVPDLSFGTHFFQDLVEADIRYLPLYPDEEGAVFNEAFFNEAHNVLGDVLPEFAGLEHVVKLIDVPRSSEGRILKVLMNAELDRAVAYLHEATEKTAASASLQQRGEDREIPSKVTPESAWHWRLDMAEAVAAQLEPNRFGVAGLYLFGSTKNATAGPASDIDLIIHFQGNKKQKKELEIWLEAWSLSLDEINFLQTGYRTHGLLDLHFVSDEDIAEKRYPASLIDAVTNPALALALRK
jgi:predicted nucleotidyltransferase